MITPPQKPHSTSFKNFINGTKALLENPLFQGVGLLASLIASIINDALWARILALLILCGFILCLWSVIWQLVRAISIWLTWKFVLGVGVGLLLYLPLTPIFEPVYRFGISLITPQVDVLDISPQNGETIEHLYSRIVIHFSQRIPSQRHSPPYVRVEITPNIPLQLTWIYEGYDARDCCRILFIQSDKYFPHINGPQFEPNTTYHLKISGLLLKSRIDTEFHTPPQ